MKLFGLALASGAQAFFGIPQFSGIGVQQASGPQTHTQNNACDILPTDPKCADCEKVGAACLDEANLEFCEKMGFNSMLNKCKTFGPPSKLTGAPGKKPKKPKAPKAPKKPKKSRPTCSTEEPADCKACFSYKGKCKKPFKMTCKKLCAPVCAKEDWPTDCEKCKVLTGDCAKDKKVKVGCKKMCRPPKTGKSPKKAPKKKQ